MDITAESAEQALKQAAEHFDTDPDNIEITGEPPKFTAELINADASIQIQINPDKTKAVVSRYIPPKGDGSPLNENIVEHCLKEAGVVVEPDPKAVAKIVSEPGKDIEGIVLARAVPVQEPADAYIKPEGDFSMPVFPEDIVGYKVEAVQPAPGRLVTGETIPPKQDRRPQTDVLASNHNTVTDPDGRTLRSKVYGLVIIEDGLLRVEPLIKISDDKLKVVGSIYPRDYKGEPCSVGSIKRILDSMEVALEPDEERLKKILNKAVQTGEPVKDVTIVAGSAPKHGDDGRFELLVAHESTVGKETEHGRMDFRDRGVIPTVKEGEIIGCILPPKKGVPGEDVFGHILPARDGKEFHVSPGQNVEFAGEDQLRATADGLVVRSGSQVYVSDTYVVEGDVDLSVGNIHLDKGSVIIKGMVRDGFKVIARGKIVIGDCVESAFIRSGDDVEVQGGIIMKESGEVYAEGDVIASFAENATIKAEGDVNVANSITNCRILAKGSVRASTSKGKIIGGTIQCNREIESYEIGSELGVTTEIVLGSKDRLDPALLEEKKVLKQKLAKIESAVGTGDERTILSETPKDKQQKVAQILNIRNKLRDRLAEIEKTVEEYKVKRKDALKGRVKVHGRIYPGVRVTIGGYVKNIQDAFEHCVIYYNQEKDAVSIGSL